MKRRSKPTGGKQRRTVEAMNATIETINGKMILKVFYDPALCNWNEAIAIGLASYGLKTGHVAVIAKPLPENASSQGELFER